MKEVTLFLLERGLSEEFLLLLLTLPIVTTLIGFGRHFIGIRTIGIYTPIVLTYAFYLLGITETNGQTDLLLGVRLGLIISILVYALTSLGQTLTKKIRLHYLPKVAIIISSVTIIAFLVLLLAAQLEQTAILRINPVALILIITTSEQFVSTFVKKGFSTALLLSFETIIVALISYAILSWPSFQNLLLTYPVISLLAIPLNFIIGSFKGLRIREYFRFQDILSTNEPSRDSSK